MTNTNKKIDKIANRERWKTIIPSALIILPFLFILLFFGVPPMGATSQVSGEVVKLLGFPGDVSDNLFLSVKLKNGEIVKAPITNSSLYQQGKMVSLQKQEPILIGRTVYNFQGYITKP